MNRTRSEISNESSDQTVLTGTSASVTLVIVNKDDRSLADTLEVIESQLGSTLNEVVVVDASQGRLDDIREKYPWTHWIDYQQPEGVHTSIAHQRNIGVRRAEGNIIVFTDSGCIPQDGWLERLLDPILTEGEEVTAGPAQAVGKSVYSGHRWWGNSNDEYVKVAPTINLAFRREAFDSVDGFDETFAAAEDLDFTWRLFDQGYRLRWVRDAVVTHDWGTPSRQLRRAFFYGRGWSRLLKKHPHRLGEAARQNSVPFVYPIFLLGLPLTVKWRWYPFLLLWPLWRSRNEELPWLILLDHLVSGAGVLYEFVFPGG